MSPLHLRLPPLARFRAALCVAVLLLATAPVARAQQVAPDLEPIFNRLEAQQREIEQLRSELMGVRDEITRLPPVEPIVADETTSIASGLADPQDARFKKIEGELNKIKEAEKKKADAFPTHKITGFMQLDTGYYGQTPENIATVGNGQDGTGFRRARLAVNGKVSEFTAYQIEVDFATAGRPSFFDCWVEEQNLPNLGSVKVGQYCQPFSVDALTGFRNLTFLERSLPFLAMVPFRRVGIQSSNISEDESTQWAYSLYRTGGYNNAPLGDDRFATDFGDIGGYSFATRATHLLYFDEHAGDRYLWHVGGGYTFAMLGANDAGGAGTGGNAGAPIPFYQARTTPEFQLGYPELGNTFGSAVNGTPNFVDTGRYAANNFNLFGVETVYQSGPWGVQSEYMATVVDSVSAGSVVYQGAYAQIAYRLTGESRIYDKKTGTLGKLIPYTDFIPLGSEGIWGWGAWEVAARYSVIDLRNPGNIVYLPGSNGNGNGLLQDTTVGATWFLNQHFKVQFNWIHAMLDNVNTGNSTGDLFVGRCQVDF